MFYTFYKCLEHLSIWTQKVNKPKYTINQVIIEMKINNQYNKKKIKMIKN